MPGWNVNVEAERGADVAGALESAGDEEAMPLPPRLDDLLNRAAAMAAASEAASGSRLQATVVRPLAKLSDGSTDPSGDGPPLAQAQVDEQLWRLAGDLMAVASHGEQSADLLEAIAGVLSLLAGSDGADVASRMRLLDGCWTNRDLEVRVQSDGPYLVTGNPALVNWLGDDVAAASVVALCRCGRSASKPFCDGTHADVAFSGAKDPHRVPDHRDTYDGQRITVFDNRGVCAHSGFCTDRVPTAFRAGGEPFVAPSGARLDELVKASQQCPSGALSFAVGGREMREEVDTNRPATVEISKDGPYRLTGGIPLLDAGGTAVARNEGASLEHYSLCRCGQSQNKPFCSGMHWYVSFRDPVAAPDHAPTVFEWAGGLPALLRMTRIFYEKYVPEDPLIGPLFATMAPDHPERVACWLAEVLGGPELYSSRFGGYSRMISQHLEKHLTEDQRSRWVALLRRSAVDAGLPGDAEFTAAFSSYLEWGSHLAVENSQSGAQPPHGMPVPRWSWVNNATPGARQSAEGLEGDGGADIPAPLPSAGEPLGFGEHIKELFRPKDRQSMLFAFDLWQYGDVAANATGILARLRNGSMPCDGAWAPDKIDVFERWITTGMPESADQPAAATPAGDDPVTATTTATDGPPIGGLLGRSVALRSPTPIEEQPLVIEHREPLIYMLCAAAELEHALMCEYLFAAFTLKKSVDEGLTAEQLEAVQRWRSTLLLVARQEMLHLAINSNLITALGASPHLSRPNLPQPARHYPAGVKLALLPFGEEALRHFLYLERPEGMDIADTEGLVAMDRAIPVMDQDEIVPHLQDFATVGHLYRSIEGGIRHLSEKWGEDKLFLGPVEAQARGELFGWPQLEPIANCDAAVRAIESIVEQGEGPRGDWRNAHFGRFLTVLDEYLDMRAAQPDLAVARPVLPALVRQPESGDDVELITDPHTARIADLGNVAYEVLLQVLYRLLCHVDESDEQMQALSQVSLGLMSDVIEPLAELVTTLPVGPEHPDRTAGPTFELFYQPDYLLPHRRAAWLLMAEHLAEAAVLCAEDEGNEPALRSVAEAMRRLSDTLLAHIEP